MISVCVECDGTSICIHKRIKRRCKECQGSEICSHVKFKKSCRECTDVKNLCLYDDCNKFAYFNVLGEKLGKYCSEHKLTDMVDVKHRKCLEDGCDKSTSYNFPGNKTGTYCSKHKLDGMINIKHKKCMEEKCEVIARFNFVNLNGIYCSKHKKEGMVDTSKRRECKETDCKISPNFNYKNESLGVFCSKHKKEGMINLIEKTCQYNDCESSSPAFNYDGEKRGIYCFNHKLENMVNVKHKRCSGPGCTVICGNKHNGYCVRCFINLFPNEKMSRNYKVKEQHVVDFIKENFQETFQFDKRTGGCSQKRPDVYIDLYTHVLIVECDENQHKQYEDICENKRMMHLFEDFGNRPIVFIRFNPDGYIDEQGIKQPSCFKYHKQLDVPGIRDKTEWDNRLKCLKECIETGIRHIPEIEITTVHLFFDKKLN